MHRFQDHQWLQLIPSLSDTRQQLLATLAKQFYDLEVLEEAEHHEPEEDGELS